MTYDTTWISERIEKELAQYVIDLVRKYDTIGWFTILVTRIDMRRAK